jgi:hypothetical protein
MATAVAQPTTPVKRVLGRRYDHIFFSGIALLILATVFVGFAPTYFLAGVFQAPLPAPIIHIHGAIFSLWVLLLVTQTSLVSAGRVSVHRRLGIAGFLLACSMVIIGVLAATNALGRNFAPPGLDPLTFYIVPITDMVIFVTLIYFAFRNRFDPSAHKRLIILATTALMIAPIARWPLAMVHRKPFMAAFFAEIFVLLLVAYDLLSIRKIHRATLWGGVFLIVVQQLRVPVGKTAAWHAFASWVQTLGHVAR